MKKLMIILGIIIMLNGCSNTDNYKASEDETTKNAKIKVGDFIEHGIYYNSPILWRVINLDKDGDPIIFSEYIICLKAFDGEEKTVESGNYKVGSNFWNESNLRQWLNSNEEKIDWINEPPSKENVWENSYDKEEGFLNSKNFSIEEVDLLKLYNHRVLLGDNYLKYKKGGEKEVLSKMREGYTFDYEDFTVEDYKKGYYTEVKDRVFLIGFYEMKKYIQEKGWSARRKLTENAKKNTVSAYSGERYYPYWSIDPNQYNYARTIESEKYNKNRSERSPQEGFWGVCPVAVLDDKKIGDKTGEGTRKKPYKLKIKK